MKTKKKAIIIGLSIVGGSFVSAAFTAAFICTTPTPVANDNLDAYEDFAYLNSDEHVSSYKTTFNDKKTGSQYEVKYEDSIKEAGEKLANYTVQQTVKDNATTYTYQADSENVAALYIENFIDNFGKEIENFFKQIKSDREKVQTEYRLNYNALKKAFNNDVNELEDAILDCERYIAELDKDAEDYNYKVENYEYQIEITRIEIKNTQVKYEQDVALLNDTYVSDLDALDYAEEQVNILKESYEAQIEQKEQVEIAPVEEIIEEFNEQPMQVEATPVFSCVREAKSASIKEEEPEQVMTETVVETVEEFNCEIFSFKCFDHCYLYVEPKDKDSYWHF